MHPLRREAVTLLNSAIAGSHLSRDFAGGHLVRLHPGQYVPAQEWAASTPLARYRVQLEALSAHTRPVFCCESALVLLGIPTFGVPSLITTLGRGGRFGEQSSRFGGPDASLDARGSAALPRPALHVRHRHDDASVQAIGAHLTVAPATAAGAVILRGSLPCALTVADSAVRSGPGAVEGIASALQHVRQPRLRERSLLRLAAGRAGAQSPAESGSRAVILGAGFPEPQLQHRFMDEQGFVADVDAWWPELGLVGEVDGQVKYTDPAMTRGLGPLEVLGKEKNRENRILALGVHLRRWGWAEIVHPQRLIALLSSAGLVANPRNALH